MIAGVKDKRAELFTSDITGNYFSYHANAIGENDEKIKERLRERHSPELNIKKGVKIALDIFKEIQGKNFNLDQFELAYIKNEDAKIKRIVGEGLKDFTK